MSESFIRLAAYVKEQCGVDLLRAPPETDASALPDALASVAEVYSHGDFAETNPPVFLPFGMMRLLPWNKAVGLWEELVAIEDEDEAQFFDETEDSGRIRAVIHHSQRFPVAYDEAASAYLLVDFIPGPKGTAGQVIATAAEASFDWLASSVDAFFGLLCDHLHSRVLAFAEVPSEYGSGFWLVDAHGKPVDGSQLAKAA